MKLRIFGRCFVLILAFTSTVCFESRAHNEWKSSGEYLEAEYFSALYELSKSGTPGEIAKASLDALGSALEIYRSRAESGDADAQFRLGTYFERVDGIAAESTRFWYSKAAAQGHQYASDKLAGRDIRASSRCDYYSEMLLTPSYNHEEAFTHVESLALLGQSECMLAMANWFRASPHADGARSYYWFYRAILLTSTKGQSGKPFFDLAEMLREYLGEDHKTVISLFERAAREGDQLSIHWLEAHESSGGQLAHASFLAHEGYTDASHFIMKSVFGSQGAESWNLSDRDNNNDSRITRDKYFGDLRSIMVTFAGAGNDLKRVAATVLAKKLSSQISVPWMPANALAKTAVFTLANLASPVDTQNSVNLIQYLKNPLSQALDISNRLLLLEAALKAVAPKQRLELVAQYDLISQTLSEIERIWPAATKEFFRRLQTSLALRSLLADAPHVSQLDAAIQKSMGLFWREADLLKEKKLQSFSYSYESAVDEGEQALLKEAIELAKESKQGDFFLLVAQRVFANELGQLDFSMRLSDLLAGMNADSSDRSHVTAAVQTLVCFYQGNPGLALTAKLVEFPKIKILAESGLSLTDLSFDRTNPLNLGALLNFEELARASQRQQATNAFYESNFLAATLSPRHIGIVKNRFDEKLRTLSEEIAEFRRNQDNKNFLADSNFAHQISKRSLSTHLKTRKQELKNQIAELIATQKSLDARLDVAGNLGKAKDELRNSAGLKVFERVAGQSEHFSVSPSDSRMSQIGNAAPESPMFSHKSITLKKNEVLNLRVSGEWSPTCAIKRSGLVGALERPSVGPEGFRLVMAVGESSNKSENERNSFARFKHRSTTDSASFDIVKLLGPGAAAGGPPGTLVGGGLGSMASSDASAGHSAQKTAGTSSSSESSCFQQSSEFKTTSSSFQSGLRLRDTPYPDAPVGAYLAVVLSREEQSMGKLITSMALSGQNTIVAQSDCVVFLVVNDCQDNQMNGGVLSIQTHILKPATTEIEKLIDVMEQNLRAFVERGSKLVMAGGDFSSIETLKAAVLADLSRGSVVDFMAEPTLRNIFKQCLTQEGDAIVRKARVIDLTRAILLNMVEIEALETQLKEYTSHEEHLSSRLNQVVRNIQSVPLYDAISNVVYHATAFLLPLLELYNPGEANSFKGLNPAQADLATLAQYVARLSSQMLKGLDSELKLLTEEYIIVRIPRPGTKLDAQEKEAIPTIDDERAISLWNHLFNLNSGDQEFGLKLEFQDLYQVKTLGSLHLGQEVPIILDMALIFGVDETTVVDYFRSEFANLNLELHVNREQTFPKSSGPKHFIITNEDLCVYTLKASMVNTLDLVNNAVSCVRDEVTMNLNTANGLSPFSIFSLSEDSKHKLQRLKEVLDVEEDGFPKYLESVFVAMKISSTHRNQPMNWIHDK